MVATCKPKKHKNIDDVILHQTTVKSLCCKVFKAIIKLTVKSEKSPFSSSLIFHLLSFSNLEKLNKINGLQDKNQTDRYNQTGR